MTRHSLQPAQCRTRRGDTRCQRGTDHEGPHRAEHHDENGADWIRWWFTNSHGWMSPLMSDPTARIRA